MADFIPLENSCFSNGGKSDLFTRPKGQYSPRSSPSMNSPQHSSDFIPLGSSSPVFRNRGGSTPNWNNRRGHNRNRSNGYNPYISKNNSPHFYRNKFSPHNFQGRRGSDNPGHNCDITKYYHPSMLQDPWLELETERSKNVSSSNNSIHEDCTVPSPTNSSEEESDSQESFACSGTYS